MKNFARILIFACFAFSLTNGQDPVVLNCTYQVIGKDGVVLTAFDDGHPGAWIGKVTTDDYQEAYEQHWKVEGYLGLKNLTTLTPEKNIDNNVGVTLRPGTSFPLQNIWNVTHIGNNRYKLQQTLFEKTDESRNYTPKAIGCLQNMGPNQRVRLGNCTENEEYQVWSFNLIRSKDDRPKEKDTNKERNKYCDLK